MSLIHVIIKPCRPSTKACQPITIGTSLGDPELPRFVTWQRLGPLDDPQQLFLAQPVEAAEQEMGNDGLAAVVLGVHHLRFDVFQDADDLLGELNLTDARYARHGGQGLVVAGHGQVGLEHHGRGHTQGFQGSETFQLPACVTDTRPN